MIAKGGLNLGGSASRRIRQLYDRHADEFAEDETPVLGLLMKSVTLTIIPAEAVIDRDGSAITTSLIVAEVFGKRHDNVLRDIEVLLQTEKEMIEEVNALRFEGVNFLKSEATFLDQQFIKTTYLDQKGEGRPVYEMTEEGFMLLVMGYTGTKALRIKIAWVQEFIAMRDHILEQQSLFQDTQKALPIGTIRDVRIYTYRARPYVSRWDAQRLFNISDPDLGDFQDPPSSTPTSDLVPFLRLLTRAEARSYPTADVILGVKSLFPPHHPFHKALAA